MAADNESCRQQSRALRRSGQHVLQWRHSMPPTRKLTVGQEMILHLAELITSHPRIHAVGADNRLRVPPPLQTLLTNTIYLVFRGYDLGTMSVRKTPEPPIRL